MFANINGDLYSFFVIVNLSSGLCTRGKLEQGWWQIYQRRPSQTKPTGQAHKGKFF
jgi:hypothetical protein